MRAGTPLSSGVVFLQRVSDDKVRQARDLRRKMTPAEKVLWGKIRNSQLAGMKFRRQQVIEGFIVDFFSHKEKIVIEVDGEIHSVSEQKVRDEHRRRVFEARGLKEIRFSNREILSDIKTVLEKIKAKAVSS
jgi:very-short-patch-repair endonuclease